MINPVTSWLELFYAAWQTGSINKAFLGHTEGQLLSQGKGVMPLFEMRYELFAFFMKNHFLIERTMADKLGLLTLGHLAGICFKTNKGHLYPQDNDWQYLLPMITLDLASKTAIWRAFSFVSATLTSIVFFFFSQQLFPDEISGVFFFKA